MARSKTTYAPKLSAHEQMLIAQAKAERRRLREQASELSDKSLAAKFEVSKPTIERIPEWEE